MLKGKARRLILDNNNLLRNTIVIGGTEKQALSEGASRLKTFNIRFIIPSKNNMGTIGKDGFYTQQAINSMIF